MAAIASDEHAYLERFIRERTMEEVQEIKK